MWSMLFQYVIVIQTLCTTKIKKEKMIYGAQEETIMKGSSLEPQALFVGCKGKSK